MAIRIVLGYAASRLTQPCAGPRPTDKKALPYSQVLHGEVIAGPGGDLIEPEPDRLISCDPAHIYRRAKHPAIAAVHVNRLYESRV